MPRSIAFLALLLLVAVSQLQAEEKLNHLAAAKAGVAQLHAACDEWAAAQDAGKDTIPATRKINAGYFAYLNNIDSTTYNSSSIWLLPFPLAAAGKLEDPDGTTYSYLVGQGQTGLIMTTWQRKPSGSDREILESGGVAATLGIDSDTLRNQLNVTAATWADNQHNVLRIPYTLGDLSGTIELRREGRSWKFHPDCGSVVDVAWKPLNDSPSTQPTPPTNRAQASP